MLKENCADQNEVALRVLTKADAALVERWLRTKHVRRWWGDPDKNLFELNNLPVSAHARLILTEGSKVGLIVWQHPTRAELDQAGLAEIPVSVIDIDLMIGEYEQIGRGLGPKAIGLVTQQVLADEAVPYVMAATSLDNHASRRAFAKAGFSEVREFDDSEIGRAVLMVIER